LRVFSQLQDQLCARDSAVAVAVNPFKMLVKALAVGCNVITAHTSFYGRLAN
jgi:hypothetical protein